MVWEANPTSSLTQQLQLNRNKVSIGDEEIYCINLEQWSCSNVRRILWGWIQGFVGGAMHCQLCGAVEGTVAQLTSPSARWWRGWGSSLGEPGRKRWRKYCCSERRQKRRWRGASFCWRRSKKRNGSTNSGTWTSVVRTHMVVDKKAEPRRTSSTMSTSPNVLKMYYIVWR